jgi:hypothetical protein
MVETTNPRKAVESITIDGKKVDVGVVAYDTVWRPVQLTASHEIVTQAISMDIRRQSGDGREASVGVVLR